MATVVQFSTYARAPRRRQIAIAALVLVAVWLVLGFLRGTSIAAAGLTAFEAPRMISAATTTTFPAIPPFFIV